MKILLSWSAFLLFIFLGTVQGGLTSCTKDNTIYDTVTVVKKDTVTVVQKDTVIVKDTITIEDTVVTESILTANQWKIKELRGLNEGTVLYYLRGGSSNTDIYDNEYCVFSTNHTGYEVSNIFVRSEISNWQLDENNKKLLITYQLSPSTSMVITWENLRYKDGALHYDEYYYNPVIAKDFHGHGIRIPK